MILRDTPDDLETFCDVYGRNEYALPASMEGETVIDIGAHVGSFALACLHRNCDKVVSFEPDTRNATILMLNIHPYGERAEAHNLAVWRSDNQGELPRMIFRGCTTCSHAFAGGDWPATPHVGLDAILDRFPQATMLKIDAEGSEFPILATCTKLGQFRRIVGELHPMLPEAAASVGAEATEEWLRQRLERDGFEVAFAPNGGNVLFFAAKKVAP